MILELIKQRVEELPEMQEPFSELLQDLSALEKQVLVERHLISREHAAKSVGSAIIMNRKQTLSVMVNEEAVCGFNPSAAVCRCGRRSNWWRKWTGRSTASSTLPTTRRPDP